MFAVAIADREVAGVALPVERARRILATVAREVVHGCESSWPGVRGEIIRRKYQTTLMLAALE